METKWEEMDCGGRGCVYLKTRRRRAVRRVASAINICVGRRRDTAECPIGMITVGSAVDGKRKRRLAK